MLLNICTPSSTICCKNLFFQTVFSAQVQYFFILAYRSRHNLIPGTVVFDLQWASDSAVSSTNSSISLTSPNKGEIKAKDIDLKSRPFIGTTKPTKNSAIVIYRTLDDWSQGPGEKKKIFKISWHSPLIVTKIFCNAVVRSTFPEYTASLYF